MTGREYLGELQTMELRLRTKEREYERIRADISSIRGIDYARPRTTGGNPSSIADKIARLESVAERLKTEWDELIERREEARGKINLVKNERYRAILIERYINGRKWGEIAETIEIEMRWLMRIHKNAVAVFSRAAGFSHEKV